jgi:lipoyl-dependent peroxiredoxin
LADSHADCTWNGNLTQGKGTVRPQSGAFPALPVSWDARTQRTQGTTSPEELIAAALATCWCMALSHELTQQGHAPTQIDAGADVHFEAGKITTAKVTIRGRVPGIDQRTFEDAAKKGCPVSRALAGTEVSLVGATLEG